MCLGLMQATWSACLPLSSDSCSGAISALYVLTIQVLNIVLSMVSDGHVISGTPKWEITGDRWKSLQHGQPPREASSHWLTFQHRHFLPFSPIPSTCSFSSSPHVPNSPSTMEHISTISSLQLFKPGLLLSMNYRSLASSHLPKRKTSFSLRLT